MIKYIFFLFLFSAGLFCPLEAIASGGLTHTHTTPALELKPISPPANSYQTAAVCFLGVGDCQQGGYGQGDDDMDTDAGKQCQNAGFTRKTCNAVQDPVKDCGHDTGFVTDCKCKKNLITCAAPKFGVGTACDGKYASCQCPATVALSQPNDRCTQNCDGKCIAKTCSKSDNEPNCRYGTYTCGDGCGGYRECCNSAPAPTPTPPTSGGGSSGGSSGGGSSGGSGGGSSTPAKAYWGGYYYSNGGGWCSIQTGGGYAFVYSVTQGCRNRDTGEEHAILRTSDCYSDGKKYSTKAECDAKGTYGWTGYYGAECVDPYTMPRGTTSC